jgi:hypothetical protein
MENKGLIESIKEPERGYKSLPLNTPNANDFIGYWAKIAEQRPKNKICIPLCGKGFMENMFPKCAFKYFKNGSIRVYDSNGKWLRMVKGFVTENNGCGFSIK